MATLYVTEYAELAAAQGGGRVAQVPMEPPLVEQAIAITGSSTQTAAFNAKTTLLRVETDAICGYTFGTNPTATVASAGLGSARLVAGQTQFHAVRAGTAMKVAVISTT